MRSNVANSSKAPDRGLISFAHQSSRPTVNENISSRQPDSSKITLHTGKRIGILRRPEPTLPSHSLDTLPIPNVPIIDPPKIQHQTSPPLVNVGKSSIHESPPSLDIPNVNLKSITLSSNSSKNNHTVSSVVSSSSTSNKKRSSTERVRSSQSSNKAPSNVPYWLKPSPLQVYPYNFIMAVRKKLELIAHPVVLPVEPKPVERKVDKSVQSTPAGRPNYFKKKTNLTSKLQKEVTKETNSEPSSISEQIPSINVKSHSQTLTNLSSMSLHIPESSRIKEVQGNAATDSDGTSSISSAIFSQSSPEKKKPVSLSTANVDQLKLNTRNISLHKHPFVNMRRGAEIDHYSLKSHQSSSHLSEHLNASGPPSSSSKSMSKPSVEPTEMVDMLNSFNQSLSHAIAVNQQLHNALMNPPSSSGKSSHDRHNRDVEDDEYSSKFDSATTSGNNTNRESLLINESSVHASSLASESVVNTARDSDRVRTTDEASLNPASVSNDPTTCSRTNNTPSVIFNLSAFHKDNRPSVIVKNTSSSTISSDINAFSSNNDPSAKSLSRSDEIKAQNFHSESQPSPKRSSTSSILTEFSDQVPRFGDNDNNQALLSVRSVSTANSESFSTRSSTQNSSSVRTEKQSLDNNKENVSSSLNTIVDTKLTKHSSTSSIISNTIHDSTIEFKAHDGFQTYRNGNSSVIHKTKSDEDLNQSIGSDIFAAFSQTDHLEMSTSEANMSYATLGMVCQK